MIKIYTASKLRHSEMWKSLNIENVKWTARWPRLHVGTVPDGEVYAKLFWQHDLEDVQNSDLILVYSEEDDKLRGALVEAGMAIALGKPVILIGEHPDYGTWQYHPLVYRVKDLEEAKILIKCFNMK